MGFRGGTFVFEEDLKDMRPSLANVAVSRLYRPGAISVDVAAVGEVVVAELAEES